MNIVVCLHAPPSADAGGLGRDDARAVELALAVAARRSGAVTALLAGTSREVGPLQAAVAAGVDRAVRLTGDDFAAADFHTLGQALSAAIRRLGADLVLAGARSDDEGLGAVPAAIARHLAIPCVAGADDVAADGDRAVEVAVRGGGRKRRLRVTLPAVVSVVALPAGRRLPADASGEGRAIELLSLSDPEATVVRRRTELLGRVEPAARGAEQVSSAAALIAALMRR